MFVYLATGLTPGENNLDADEFLDVYEIELEEAYNMVLKMTLKMQNIYWIIISKRYV